MTCPCPRVLDHRSGETLWSLTWHSAKSWRKEQGIEAHHIGSDRLLVNKKMDFLDEALWNRILKVKLFQPVVHCGLKRGGFTNFWASIAQTLIFVSSKKECQRQSILRIEVFLNNEVGPVTYLGRFSTWRGGDGCCRGLWIRKFCLCGFSYTNTFVGFPLRDVMIKFNLTWILSHTCCFQKTAVRWQHWDLHAVK